MSAREFTIAIEITAEVTLEDWDSVPAQELIDKVALNVIGAILEHNPEYSVRRLRPTFLDVWQ